MTKHVRGRGRGRGRRGRGEGAGRGRASNHGASSRRQQGHQNNQQRNQQPHPPPQQRVNRKPPRFEGFRGRPDRFLEQSDPQFQEVVSKCYAGFRVEGPETFAAKVHSEARRAFDGLEEGGIFRADVTQPFGLGTKCAVTYVTRTLAGEPGTTYKYLGLRMFSHPWTEQSEPGSHSSSSSSSIRSSSRKGSIQDGGGGIRSALRRVRILNDHLRERSLRLLEARRAVQQEEGARRGESGGGGGGDEEEFGSCDFNVALINRMEPLEDRPDLKPEPTFGQDRCSVSWHADSCLEHYSTIAVYHVTDPDTKESNDVADDSGSGSGSGGGGSGVNFTGSGADWRIALRVEPDAEGPSAGKLKLAAVAGGSEGKTDRAPPVAVALPSRSAYFLLDDFNHHHQHAVLAGQTHRWSSTHRVAKKQGHSFDYIAGRCQTVLGDGHRRTLKQWKTEQLTLSELEFEWIRQFYIQGRAHHALHTWWHEPLQQLLRFWSLLESRTGVVVNTLQGAAEARFDQQHAATAAAPHKTSEGPTTAPDERREKKARQRRSKQRQAVESLGGRAAYAAIAEALRDRAEKRGQWADRERDKVYDRLPADARPMPCPLSPSASCSAAAAAVSSPLPRTPEALAALADAVLEWGKIYSGGDGVRGAAAAAAAAEVCDVGGGDVRAAPKSSVGAPNDVERGAANGDESEHRSSSTNQPANSPGDWNPAAGRAAGATAAAALRTSPSSTGTAAGTPTETNPPWETGRFALEMQAPWARRLLDGEKTIETRGYPLPAGLVGRSVELMESRPGQDGVSSVGDTVEAFADGLSVVGRVVFSGSSAYPSREAWAADAERHLVPVPPAAQPAAGETTGGKGSSGGKGYGWKGPGSVHAWTVGSVAAYPKPRAVRRMERAFRSLFLVEDQRRGGRGGASSSGGAVASVKRGGAEDDTAVVGRGGEGGGDDGAGSGEGGTKRKKKPKKKRKRKGPPAGGGGDGGEAQQAPADTARAECAVAAAGAVGDAGAAERPRPAKENGGEERKRRMRPRAAGADGKQGIVAAAGGDAATPGSAGGDAPQPRGIGGGDRSQQGGGKKRRSGKGSAELGGRDKNEGTGGVGTTIAALAAAAASARGTGDGFDEGIDGEGGGGDFGGEIPTAISGGGDSRKRSKKKKRF
eukprot:g1621.t1